MSCGERLAAELRKKGFRVTPQRAVILETIAHEGGHLSAQEVYIEACERLPGLNIATVYRTLDSLHSAGLIDLLSSGSKPVHFSLRDPSNPHGHLVCRKCERIFEINPEFVNRIVQEVKQETGFVIDAHHLTLTGLCEMCLVDDLNQASI